MLNSKRKIAVGMLFSTLAATSANAQFFDLTEQGSVSQINRPTGNYQSSANSLNDESLFADRVEENPVLDTSGDEGGFIPTVNPDETVTQEVQSLPVAQGFDAFSTSLVNEEEVKEQLRDIKQLDYVGFLDENFDEALWVGVSYDYAKARFAQFKNIKSIHMRKVARDMLMSKARAPQTNNSWLALRLATLLEMGDLSDVKLLLKEVSPKELILLENAELNSLYLKAYLLEPATADFIKKLVSQDAKNLDYKKSLLISLYNQGKTSAVKLSFNALVDNDAQVENSNFAKIFSAVLNEKELDVANLTNLDVFEQYLIALNSDLFVNVDYTKFADQTLLVAINNATDLSEKTKVAEILMQNYPFAYPLATLTSVYDEHKFTSKDLSVPLTFIQNSNDEFKNRAVFFQASKVNGLNSTKAVALRKLWESYNKAGLENLKLLITEKTQNINVNSSISWLSIDLLKNELKQANLDASTLKTLYENIDNVYSNANILDLQIAVEFLRKTSLVTDNFDAIQSYKETLNAWFNSKKITTTAQYMHVLRVLTLLDALEAPIDENIWAKLYEKSNLEAKTDSNPVWLRLITSSMQKEEKGKSLLLVLEKFAKQNSADMDPQTLANIISALNYLNMPQEMALVGTNAIVK